MPEELWKPIANLNTSHAIIGGWFSRGEWRFGVCRFSDATGAWYSDRGATPSHWLVTVPVGPVAPAGDVSEPFDPVVPEPA